MSDWMRVDNPSLIQPIDLWKLSSVELLLMFQHSLEKGNYIKHSDLKRTFNIMMGLNCGSAKKCFAADRTLIICWLANVSVWVCNTFQTIYL
jgi:hypothetical protein